MSLFVLTLTGPVCWRWWWHRRVHGHQHYAHTAGARSPCPYAQRPAHCRCPLTCACRFWFSRPQAQSFLDHNWSQGACCGAGGCGIFEHTSGALATPQVRVSGPEHTSNAWDDSMLSPATARLRVSYSHFAFRARLRSGRLLWRSWLRQLREHRWCACCTAGETLKARTRLERLYGTLACLLACGGDD